MQPIEDEFLSATSDTVATLQRYARGVAQKYSIPWPIFNAWIEQESGWNTGATSPAGAQGIAQIMPGTASSWGVNPWDPFAALDAAAQHLSEYYTQYGNSWPNALAAYNAGPGAVEQYHGVPPYAETQSYVSKILGAAGLGGSAASGSAASSPGSALPAGSSPSSTPQPIEISQGALWAILAGAIVLAAIGIAAS